MMETLRQIFAVCRLQGRQAVVVTLPEPWFSRLLSEMQEHYLPVTAGVKSVEFYGVQVQCGWKALHVEMEPPEALGL